MRINCYHSVDIDGSNREYGFTTWDTPRDTVESKTIDISPEEFARLLETEMVEVKDYVITILRNESKNDIG